MCNKGGNSTPAFGADKSQNLRPVAILALFAPSANSGNGVEQLLGIERLQKVFTAAASHRLDDQVGLRLRGNRKNASFRRIGMDAFCHQRGAAPVVVEIQKTDIGRRISDPIQNTFVIIHTIVVQMFLQLHYWRGIGEKLENPPRLLIQADTDH